MIGLVGGGTPEQQQQRAIRVLTRSRYFKPGNHHEKGFIMSTHSMFRGGGEVNTQTPPTQQIVTTSYPTTSSTLTYLLSSNNSSARTTTASSNNMEQSFALLNSPTPFFAQALWQSLNRGVDLYPDRLCSAWCSFAGGTRLAH